MKLDDLASKNFGIIYKAEFKNGKIYIGKTTRLLKNRKRQHLTTLYKERVAFHNAIIKYGENSVKWSVIDIANNIDELNEKEAYWISHYNSYIHAKNSNGYNMTLGGEGEIGYRHTEEAKQKISKAHTGKSFTEAHKKKLSENHADISGKNNPNYKKIFSEETRRKMSKNHADISGENNPNSKLTWENVRWIRQNKEKYIVIKLAEMFSVSNSVIYKIIQNKAWKEK